MWCRPFHFKIQWGFTRSTVYSFKNVMSRKMGSGPEDRNKSIKWSRKKKQSKRFQSWGENSDGQEKHFQIYRSLLQSRDEIVSTLPLRIRKCNCWSIPHVFCFFSYPYKAKRSSYLSPAPLTHWRVLFLRLLAALTMFLVQEEYFTDGTEDKT